MAKANANISNIVEIIDSLKFNSASKSDVVLESIVNVIIRPHVLHEIGYYRSMKRVSANRYNIITLAIIFASSGLPLVIIVCNKHTELNWIPILISSVTTVLTSINYVFNIKDEWRTNLSSFEKLKGSLTMWVLSALSIQYGTQSDDDKITSYFSLASSFLKDFNNYEFQEINDHFNKMRDVEQAKSDQEDKDDASQADSNQGNTNQAANTPAN
jgi:uncharacterized protein DUF4231